MRIELKPDKIIVKEPTDRSEYEISPEKLKIQQEAKKKIKALFIARVCLWIIAVASTAYWIYYSADLYRQEIYLPEEYSPLLRPVLYTCVAISVVAIVISFVLREWAVRIKKKSGLW